MAGRSYYRSPESYRGKTPEARAAQLSNLKFGSPEGPNPNKISRKDLDRQLRSMDVVEFAGVLGVSFEERPAQRVLLKAMYGLRLSAVRDESQPQSELEIYREIAGGQTEQHGVGEEATESVLNLGARSFKSLVTTIAALYEAICRGHIWKEHLRKGEPGYAIVVATKQAQAEKIIQKNAAELLQQSKIAYWLKEVPTKAELTLINGLKVISLPCNSTAGRGLPIFFLAFDEIGHFFNEGPKADEAIYNSLSPRLSQFPGAKTMLISTPAAKQGMFWTWFKEGFAVPGRATFHASTLRMNPLVDRAFLERQRRRDPDNYAREFDAEFCEKVSAFFSSESLGLAFTLAGDQHPDPRNWYVCGIDQSGLTGRDRFALALAHKDDTGRVIIDLCRSWDTTDSNALMADIVALKEAYHFTGATIDRYAGGWVRQALENIGLEVSVREGLPAVYQNAKSLLLAGRLAMPDNGELRAGLVNTSAYYGRNNALSIQHERGTTGHADLADAVCTAAWCATEQVEYVVTERINAITAFGVPETWED